MTKIKEFAGVIALSLCEIIIGILLLINPVGFTSAIIIAAGVMLLALGAVSVIRYFRQSPAEAAKNRLLAKGLGMVIVGLFCVLHSAWFLATFPLLTMLYGAAMLLASFIRLQWTVDALRMKKDSWTWIGLCAALSLVFSVLILFNPFASVNILWMFVSISLIAEAVMDMMTVVRAFRTGKVPPAAQP